MPKVSVIIPVYRVEKYIERCARSLFEQTLDDIEYIFLNDNTPDSSIKILEKVLQNYSKRINQVRIIDMPVNSGQAAVRKVGMLAATGDYIIHCDSDDWVDRDMYNLLWNKAINTNADVTVCDYISTDLIKFNTHIGLHSEEKRKVISNLLIQLDSWSLCNKLFKTKFYKDSFFKWPENNMGEDMAIVLQMIINCAKISYVNKPLYYYFSHSSSICNASGKDYRLLHYNQLYNNSVIVVNLFEINKLASLYKDELVAYKYYVKSYLLKYIYCKNVYCIWKSSYKEINNKIVGSHIIANRQKCIYILSLIKIYPLLSNILNTFRLCRKICFLSRKPEVF